MSTDHPFKATLPYDKVDLIHGKFFASPKLFDDAQCAACPNRKNKTIYPMRIFCEIYGVFGDSMGRYAEKLDNAIIENSPYGIVKLDWLTSNFAYDVRHSVTEEDHFWTRIDTYKWHWILFEELFKLSKSNYYLLAGLDGECHYGDRIQWILRKFGRDGYNKFFLLHDENRHLLAHTCKDLLIDCDLYNIEKWVEAGGSGFWWPQIDGKATNTVDILAKRLQLLKKVAVELNRKTEKMTFPPGTIVGLLPKDE